MTEPDVLVIDDLRSFPFHAVYARTAAIGIRRLHERAWREVWLDWNLGGTATIDPVVDLLVERAAAGNPFRIGQVYVHTSDPLKAEEIIGVLVLWYHVERRRSRTVQADW